MLGSLEGSGVSRLYTADPHEFGNKFVATRTEPASSFVPPPQNFPSHWV